jgi:hypothetical protein
MRRLVLMVTVIWIGAAAFAAQTRTTIFLEFTADGQCSIAVRGEASRAEMSYRPQAPGRCAIPAVRGEGPVRLTVLLPAGVAPPRRSTPPLTWATRDGRARGEVDLPSAPAVVDIMPPRPPGFARVSAWVLLAAAAGLGAWAVARSLWPRSDRRSSSDA